MHFVPHSLQRRKRRAPFGLAGVAAAAVIGYAVVHPTLSSPAPPTVQNTADAQAVAQAQAAFGVDLLGQLTHAVPGQNVFFSPASIATILALTMSGAGGQTRSDMSRTLHLSLLPAQQVNAGSKLLTQSENVPKSPGVTLSVANALWADKGTSFAPAFLAGAQDNFNADAQMLDFASPSAAQTINEWVSTQTHKRITEIVTPSDVTPPVHTVLTNAVYFQGKWKFPFEKEGTQDAPFTLADGKTIQVSLMSQEARTVGFQKHEDFDAARLPYGDGRFVMDVFLPHGPLASLLMIATPENMEAWSIGFHPQQVVVRLPRWKMAFKTELSKPLASLGMRKAFSRNADFAPMGLPGFHIDQVIHKAVLDVDEEGTTAAAATAVTARAMSAFRPMTVFQVDHPFLFTVRDTNTGTLLFLGVVYNPKG